jgi:hypothetical protein
MDEMAKKGKYSEFIHSGYDFLSGTIAVIMRAPSLSDPTDHAIIAGGQWEGFSSGDF